LMKDGKYFISHKPGHRAKDHRKNDFSQNTWREEAPRYEQTEILRKKWEGNELYIYSCPEYDCQIGHRREREIFEGCGRLRFLKRRTGSMSVSPYLQIHSVPIGLVE
jgi:hypothetical protein